MSSTPLTLAINRAVDDSSSLRHDLANHISVVINQSYWLLQQPQLPSSVTEAAVAILATTEVMRGLLEEVTVFQPQSQLIQTMESFRATCLQHGISFELTEARPEVELTGSSGQFRRVMQNCVENAVQALKQVPSHQSRWLIISAGTEKSKTGLKCFCIEISDNGGGILPEHLVRVCTLGFSTKSDRGSGMGLWISKTIMERVFGGSIELSSEWGFGTTVRLLFPLHPQG